MLDIRYSNKFKKDYKTIIKRGYNPQLLQDVLTILISGQPLPPKYKDHNLSGVFQGHRECHITPDWLLIYKIERNILTLLLTRTGTQRLILKTTDINISNDCNTINIVNIKPLPRFHTELGHFSYLVVSCQLLLLF